MAYDSASDTALAGQAYQRAVNATSQNRFRLQQSLGLNSDGSMDNTDAGHLGSIYQGNLASVMQEKQAARADQARGFGAGASGLGGKARIQAHQSGLDQQAANLRDATSQLDANTQERTQEDTDYQNSLGNIWLKSTWDLANNLADNPVYGAAPVPTYTSTNLSPSQVAANIAALKANPRAAQNAKNNRY